MTVPRLGLWARGRSGPQASLRGPGDHEGVRAEGTGGSLWGERTLTLGGHEGDPGGRCWQEGPLPWPGLGEGRTRVSSWGGTGVRHLEPGKCRHLGLGHTQENKEAFLPPKIQPRDTSWVLLGEGTPLLPPGDGPGAGPAWETGGCPGSWARGCDGPFRAGGTRLCPSRSVPAVVLGSRPPASAAGKGPSRASCGRRLKITRYIKGPGSPTRRPLPAGRAGGWA